MQVAADRQPSQLKGRHPAGEGPSRWRPCSRVGGGQRVGAVGHRLEPRGVVLEDRVERLPSGHREADAGGATHGGEDLGVVALDERRGARGGCHRPERGCRARARGGP